MTQATSHKRVILGVLALYALVLCTGSLLHHDFICHLKSPAHCEACTASPAAAATEAGPTVLRPTLLQSTPVEVQLVVAPTTSSTPLLPGRAPPA
jgi:hypothetical protein